MSNQSTTSILLAINGMTNDHPQWQGSIDQCWETFVVNRDKPRRNARPRPPHEVYAMKVAVAEYTFYKIGISKDANLRLKNQVTSFAIASWELTHHQVVESREIALQCESNMLTACHHLWINGEWIADPNCIDKFTHLRIDTSPIHCGPN